MNLDKQIIEPVGAFVRLDLDKVRDEIQSQQLKRWWVAEYSGIHKTTLRRWLSGRIEKVHRRRARALARSLEVELDSILE